MYLTVKAYKANIQAYQACHMEACQAYRASQAFLAYQASLLQIQGHTHPFQGGQVKPMVTTVHTYSASKITRIQILKGSTGRNETSRYIIARRNTWFATNSFSSASFILTSAWASILSLTSSSTLPVYSRKNCQFAKFIKWPWNKKYRLHHINERRNKPASSMGIQSQPCYSSRPVLTQHQPGSSHNKWINMMQSTPSSPVTSST